MDMDENFKRVMDALTLIVWKYGKVVLDEDEEIEYHTMEITEEDLNSEWIQKLEFMQLPDKLLYRVRRSG